MAVTFGVKTYLKNIANKKNDPRRLALQGYGGISRAEYNRRYLNSTGVSYDEIKKQQERFKESSKFPDEYSRYIEDNARRRRAQVGENDSSALGLAAKAQNQGAKPKVKQITASVDIFGNRKTIERDLQTGRILSKKTSAAKPSGFQRALQQKFNSKQNKTLKSSKELKSASGQKNKTGTRKLSSDSASLLPDTIRASLRSPRTSGKGLASINSTNNSNSGNQVGKTQDESKNPRTRAKKALVALANNFIISPLKGIKKVFGGKYAIVKETTPQGYVKISIKAKTAKDADLLKDKDVQQAILLLGGGAAASKLISLSGKTLTAFFGPKVAQTTGKTVAGTVIGGTTVNAAVNPSPENDALAIATVTPLLGARVVSAAKKLLKKVKIFSDDQVQALNTEISTLKSKGKGANDRELKILEEQKKIYQEKANTLNQGLDVFDDVASSAKKAKSGEAPKSKVNAIVKIQKKNTQLDKKLQTSKDKLKEFRKKAKKGVTKLRDETKAKGVKEISKGKKRIEVKKEKGLPQDKDKIIKSLYDARKKGGEAFSKLKKKIKKDLGLNVVVRAKKDKSVEIKLLEPKKNRKKGKKTGRKKEFVLEFDKSGKPIRKIASDKRNVVKVPEQEKEVVKKIKNDEPFQIRGPDFFRSKKAQAQLIGAFKAKTREIKKKVKNFKQKEKRLGITIRKYNERVKKSKDLSPKQKQKLQQQRKNLQEKRKKLNEEKAQLKKQTNTLKTNMVKGAAFAQAIKNALKPDQAEAQDFFPANETPQVPQLEPVPPSGGKGKGGGSGKPGSPKKPPSKTTKRTPTKAPQPKPKKSKVKRPTKKTTKKKPKVLISSKKKETKNPTKGKLGAIVIKKGNKLKTIKTGLPYNKAKKVLQQTLDNTLRASATIKAYGKTKKKDITSPVSKKFTTKKGKDPLVQDVVEKKKYRLDKPGEKKEISFEKALSKNIKKAKPKKSSSKKASSKKNSGTKKNSASKKTVKKSSVKIKKKPLRKNSVKSKRNTKKTTAKKNSKKSVKKPMKKASVKKSSKKSSSKSKSSSKTKKSSKKGSKKTTTKKKSAKSTKKSAKKKR